MTEVDEKHYRKLRRFCEENIESGKVGDRCHFLGKYRGPASSQGIFNVTQKQSNFFQLNFRI